MGDAPHSTRVKRCSCYDGSPIIACGPGYVADAAAIATSLDFCSESDY